MCVRGGREGVCVCARARACVCACVVRIITKATY